MGSPSAESWWMLSLVGRFGSAGESSASLLSFLLLLSMAWLTASLLCWFFPGGPAWGRYLLLSTGGRRRGVIPGPRGLPFVGSINLMSGLAHRRLAAAADRHGARRLMAFSIGETRAVVTCDPQVAREILHGAAFADRPAKESASGLLFHRAIGFAPHGVYWRTLRRIAATHLFCPKQIAATSAQRGRIAAEMVAALGTLGKDGGSVRVRHVLKQAALNNIMWSVFGRNYGIAVSEEEDASREEAEELRSLVAEGYSLLGKLNFADHLSFIAALDMQGIRRRCARLVPRVNRFVRRIIQEHRERGAAAAAPASDFVDMLLSLQSGGGGLSDSDMVAVLWEMIFRGTDTVAVAMEWVLARLVLHPDEQRKVHRELDRVVGRSRSAAGEADPPSLPHLNAVVKEVLRMHPPGPLLSWARLAVADAVVAGWVVPAGTTAMVNMWAITHDPGLWPEPDRFLPDRFLGAGGDLPSLYGSDLRLAPFGSGRRSCPGKALAMATVSSWAASLLHEFEWLPASADGGVELSEVLGLSCEMAVPLTVMLRRRGE